MIMLKPKSKKIISGNKKLKVLFVTHWAKRTGGAEHSLIDLLKCATLSADTFLVCSEDGILIDQASQIGISCKTIYCNNNAIEIFRRENLLFTLAKHYKALFAYIVYVYNLYRYVMQLKPDIIHANIPKSHIAAVLISVLGYKGKVVCHLREIIKQQTFTGFLYKLMLLKRDVSFIAISDAVRNSLPIKMNAHVPVLYNGIKVQSERPVKNYSASPKFLYLGRVVPWKGCHHIIDAFNLLYEKIGTKAGTLDIVGDPLYWDQSYKDQLINKVKAFGLTDLINFFPHTNQPDDYYNSHDVLCMASDNEPFGRVAAEAMGRGLPVIGFNSGGMREIIQNNISGLLIEQQNIEDYSKGMCLFSENPDLMKKMGMAGYDFVKCNFDLERNTAGVINYLLDLSYKNR